MEIRHLQTFQTVVKRGSFQAAARELNCAQSTVTLHVQQLEAALGVELFDRGARRMRLTEAGRALQDQATPLLGRVASLRETMAELTLGEAGHVRFGCIEPTASRRLPEILVRYCRERPHVQLAVEVGGTNSVARMVASGDLDAGVCSPPPVSLGLSFEPLFPEAMGLLLPASHPLAAAESVHSRDLSACRLLFTEETCAYRQLIDPALNERGVRPVSRVEFSSIQTQAAAVQAGLGVAIVPCIAVTPPPIGTVLRPIADLDLSLTVGIVRPADASSPGRALAALLAACRGHLAGKGRQLGTHA